MGEEDRTTYNAHPAGVYALLVNAEMSFHLIDDVLSKRDLWEWRCRLQSVNDIQGRTPAYSKENPLFDFLEKRPTLTSAYGDPAVHNTRSDHYFLAPSAGRVNCEEAVSPGETSGDDVNGLMKRELAIPLIVCGRDPSERTPKSFPV